MRKQGSLALSLPLSLPGWFKDRDESSRSQSVKSVDQSYNYLKQLDEDDDTDAGWRVEKVSALEERWR